MAIWPLTKKEFRLLTRDRLSAGILFAMPLLFILILGLLLGEGFGQKADDRLRVSVVDLDEGLDGAIRPDDLPYAVTEAFGLGGSAQSAPLLTALSLSARGAVARRQFPYEPWSHVVLRDLRETSGIRVEVIEGRAVAERLVAEGRRAAVVVLEPEFSRRMSRCSFLQEGINPFFRDGVLLDKVGVTLLRDPTQLTAASIIDQVVQVTLLRVILPYMIGEAFGKLSHPSFMSMLADRVPGGRLLSAQMKRHLGGGVQGALKDLFANYDLTGRTWSALTKAEPRVSPDIAASVAGLLAAPQGDGPLLAAGSVFPERPQHPAMVRASTTTYRNEAGSGLLNRGAARYQILVPSYTVMFAFSLVLTVGWLFVLERRQGTLKRLRAAPLTRSEILLGKFLPCFALSVVQGAFLLTAGKLAFGMSWGPADWSLGRQILTLAPVVVTTSLAAMGLAMFIAALARTEIQVALVGSLLVLVLGLLSGCLIPRELMPEAMIDASHFTPHAWALDAYRQLLMRPAPELDVSPNMEIVARSCLVLAGYGAAFIALAWGLLRLD